MKRKPLSPDIPSRGSAPMSFPGSGAESPRKKGEALDQDFWANPRAWPKGDPETVFIGNALLEIGAAMFGEQWTGRELNCRTDIVRDIVELERLDDAIEMIADHARSGSLVTLVRLKDSSLGGGEYIIAPSSLWNVEPTRQSRFRAGAFPYVLSGAIRPAQVYAFVTRKSLDACRTAIAGPEGGEIMTSRAPGGQEHEAKGKGGRPPKRRRILQAYTARLRRGLVSKDRRIEVRAIADQWRESDKPVTATIVGAIKTYHKRLDWNGANVTNAIEIADLIDAAESKNFPN